MTKSVREDPREPVKHVLPEIKVTPPVPTPTAWAQGATSAVQEAGTFPDVPARSSSRQATMFAPDASFNPFEQATPPLENVNPRYLTLPDENAATPQLTPIQSEYTLTHCDHVPTHCVPYPNLQVAPHALRRVGNAWDFMPSIQFPGRRTPINNPSRQRIVRRHAEETVGRAL